MHDWIFDLRSRPFFLLVVAFVVVSLLVYFEVTVEIDQAGVEFFQLLAGDPNIDFIMQSITEAGDIYYTLLFGIILLIIRKTRRIGITIMILIVMSTLLAGYVKCGVDRDRPDLDFIGTPYPIPLSPDTFALFCDGSIFASYPSGHVARAMVFAIILGYALSDRYPRGCYLLLIYPALMSMSRIYVLQHYPMDIIGGIILAMFLSGIMARKTKLYKIFEKSES